MIVNLAERQPRFETGPVPVSSAGQLAGIGSGISIREVTKRYGNFHAANRITLDIEPGEFVTLLGPSGSGKTTLLNLLAGFQQLDAGEILVDGRAIHNVPVHKRGFGMVFQSYALFPNMTVAQNVAFPMRMAGIDRDTSDGRVHETLEMMRLTEHAQKRPSEMSGGQQQRVAIARSIVMRPRVVLMDEPLSALDRRLRESIQIEIREIHRTIGSTFLFVTHDQSEALTMSDRIAVMDAGKIIQVDTPDEIYRRPRNRFVASFIGESNLVEAEILRRDGGVLTLTTRTGHQFRAESRDEVTGRNVTVLVRPERLQLGDTMVPGSIPAKVRTALFLGEVLRIEIELDSGEVMLVRCPDKAGQVLPKPGSPTYVSWGAQDGWVLG